MLIAIARQPVAHADLNFNCSLGLGFGDGLGLWLSSGHLSSRVCVKRKRAMRSADFVSDVVF